MTKSAVLRPGLVTSLGSLPHRDADAAAAFVLRHHPHLPAAPELPKRSPLEGMVAQAARGMAGVTVAPDGTIEVDPDGLDPTAAVVPPVNGASHGGLLAFLSLAAGRSGPIKIQLTGPLTLGLALIAAGARPEDAFPAAGAAVRANAVALLSLCRRRLPDAPLVAFVDEPGLVRAGSGDLPPTEVTIDLLSGALAVLENDAITGVHCCGPTDWRLAAAAGATVLSLPVEMDSVLANGGALSSHLEQGGWIAWGVVPTSGPLGTDAARLWRRLTGVWTELVEAGCDPALLRARALVTPACGLAGHGVSQTARALRLASTIAERVADEAGPGRLSAGA